MSDFIEDGSQKPKSNLGSTKVYSTLSEDETGSLREKISVHTIRSTPGNMSKKLEGIYQFLEDLLEKFQEQQVQIEQLQAQVSSQPQHEVTIEPPQGLQLTSYREHESESPIDDPGLTVQPFVDSQLIFKDDLATVVDGQLQDLKVRIPYAPPELEEFIVVNLPEVNLTKSSIDLKLETGETIRSMVEGSQILIPTSLITTYPIRVVL